MLNTVYDSVTIGKKIPVNEASMNALISEYNEKYSDQCNVSITGESMTIKTPKKPFDLIRMIESRMDKITGYKNIDGDIIVGYRH